MCRLLHLWGKLVEIYASLTVKKYLWLLLRREHGSSDYVSAAAALLCMIYHCCMISALLQQLWQVSVWGGRWVRSLRALWSKHRPNSDDKSQASQAASSLQPFCFLPGLLLLLPLPHTMWHNLHARSVQIMHIYHSYVYVKKRVNLDLVILFVARWPCWRDNRDPLSVRVLIIQNTLILNLLHPHLMMHSNTCEMRQSLSLLVFVLQDGGLSALSGPLTPLHCCRGVLHSGL